VKDVQVARLNEDAVRHQVRLRILAVLKPECGGARKFNVLAGLVGGADVLKPVLDALRADKLVSIRHRNGGPHYALTRRAA
jgi:hypothetical protein